MNTSSNDTSEKPVQVRALLDASPARLFEAWTAPGQLCEWFNMGPGWQTSAAETSAQKNGRYQITMQLPDGSERSYEGRYLRFQSPQRLAFSWPAYGDSDRRTTVNVEFISRGDETEVVISQAGLRGKDARTDHRNGWKAVLAQLQAYLLGF